jgi:hypothetical protein
MEPVIADDALRSRLNGLVEYREIRDESGKLLGHYLPDQSFRRMLYDWANAEFTREEAEETARGVVRTWDGTNGKTTAEAIEHLKSLWQRQAAGG